MTQPKERPILFSAPMVRAILEGRKTVTRRVLKVQPHIDASGNLCVGQYNYGQDLDRTPMTKHFVKSHYPYGQPGDRLWVRETWLPDPDADHAAWYGHTETYYSWAGCGSKIKDVPPALQNPGQCLYREGWGGGGMMWRPSIHMPRWASRIFLEITDVRVERLQAISRADIRAEGLECPSELASDDVSPNYRDWYPAACRGLWEATGGDWVSNPWVWVIEFRKL
ncbi:hypothetical protein [Pseudomonas baltica]|uniref:hypothetical protein n=1 Tax=Pseudomonas baltica TaxID=2762576 RepID=UPI0028A05EF6|nr:hypothetical protein [Pseudomonas baltica]